MGNKIEDCLISILIKGFITVVSLSVLYYISIQIWGAKAETSVKLSNIFSFISSISIISTVVIYKLQKKEDNKKQKIKDDIVKRIILNTIEQRNNTIRSIIEFSEDIDTFKKQTTTTSLKSVKINESTANLIACSYDNKVLLKPIIMYNSDGMKEAMYNRYAISDEMALITEETNQLINEIDKFISIRIIDHLSRDDFPSNIKFSNLSETKKGGRYDYHTKLNKLHERISSLH